MYMYSILCTCCLYIHNMQTVHVLICTSTACMYKYSMYVYVHIIVWNVLHSVVAIPVVRLAPAHRDTNINIHHINTSSEVVTEETRPFCTYIL